MPPGDTSDGPPNGSDDLVESLVVTGSGRGLGRHMVLSLSPGRKRILCLSASTRVFDTVAVLRDNGVTSDGAQLDLADFTATTEALTEWLAGGSDHERLGAILAAGVLGPGGPAQLLSTDSWARTMSVNFLGNLNVALAMLPLMRLRRFGRTVFLSGGGAAYDFPSFPAYSASKSAIVRTVENLSRLYRSTRSDLAFLALAPGAVATDMLAEVQLAGVDVGPVMPASAALELARAFFTAAGGRLSGKLVHVRDDWRAVLQDQDGGLDDPEFWTLRRHG